MKKAATQKKIVSKEIDIMKKKQREMFKTSVTEIKNTVERTNSRPSRRENIRDGRQIKLKNYIQISLRKVLTKHPHNVQEL